MKRPCLLLPGIGSFAALAVDLPNDGDYALVNGVLDLGGQDLQAEFVPLREGARSPRQKSLAT